MNSRNWLAVAAVLLAIALAACAPRVTAPASTFEVAYSDRGVAWIVDGKAFLARAPRFQVERVRSPVPAVDVAWNDGDAWLALPSAGWVQRVTGVGGTVQAGAVRKLSATRIYREDGSALTYGGQLTEGLLGAPDAVVTGGDGYDYALQRGRLYRIGTARLLLDEQPRGAYLTPTPTGAITTLVPSVVSGDFTYRLTGTQLQRVDATQTVRAAIPHPAGRVGKAGEYIVTVTREGAVRVFQPDLTEVRIQ